MRIQILNNNNVHNLIEVVSRNKKMIGDSM